MTVIKAEIPDGYKENAQGHLVPTQLIKEIDILRDDTVMRLVRAAKIHQAQIATFKALVLSDVDEFVRISAEQYNAPVGGQLGNITLTSYDGRFRVQRKINKNLCFDERLQVAKSLIDECIHRWSKDSSPEIKALVEHAFQVDKEGNVNTGRIYSLLQLKITDSGWIQAMNAIRDSMQVAGSTAYLNFYERIGDGDNASWKAISLDLAGV